MEKDAQDLLKEDADRALRNFISEFTWAAQMESKNALNVMKFHWTMSLGQSFEQPEPRLAEPGWKLSAVCEKSSRSELDGEIAELFIMLQLLEP